MLKIDEIADSKISTKIESGMGKTENSICDDKTKQRYWKRLKKITAIWMLAWILPAVILHMPIQTTSSIKILNGIPLHWFNAVLLSILIGVILIFLYAFVMDKTDRLLKEDKKIHKGGQ